MIGQVTHSQDSVLDLHWLEASELCAEDLETLFRRLVDQRDTQLEVGATVDILHSVYRFDLAESYKILLCHKILCNLTIMYFNGISLSFVLLGFYSSS